MKTILLAAGIAFSLYAAALPVTFLEITPVVDGETASDPGWRKSVETQMLQRLSDGAEPERPTSFRIAYGIDAFYLALEALDPNPAQLVTNAADQGELWRDDSVEIFLTDRNGRGIQLIVNAAGARYNRPLNWSDCPSPNQLWNWNAALQRIPDGYRLEMRIPYLLLPEEMDYRELYFNIGRNAQGRKSEVSTFARLSNGMFFDPEHFAPLELIHASGAESIPARLAADRLNTWRNDAPRRFLEARRKGDRYLRQYCDTHPEQVSQIDLLLQLPERSPEQENELRQLTGDALRGSAEITREQTSRILDQLFE